MTKQSRFIFEDIDFRQVLILMLNLPSAQHLRFTPVLNMRHSKRNADTTGSASWGDKRDKGRIAITVGYDSTIHNALGTLLHEVAHHTTRVLPDSGPNDADDSSPKFAKMCHDLHYEWNQFYGKRYGEVSIYLTGAYKGEEATRDYAKSHVPALHST